MSSFFKGAVSSTVGAAASVVGVGGSRRGSNINPNEIVLKEKFNLTIKETPNKDAQTVNACSVRSGFLMKRNEQGVWQKRYCCLVPHMFLYYFDNEFAESPRGVIDLEYFTEVDIQNGNILKIAPASHVQANSGFFFQIDDPNEMNDWMGSMHRDRYATVRDERDAYQQLQDQFSAQMDMTSKMLEESSLEKEKLSFEVADLQREIAAAKLALHQVLTRTTVMANALDIPAKDDSDDFDTNKMGQTIKEKLDSIKKTYDEKLSDLTETTTAECNSLKELVLSLQSQLSNETQTRRQLESQALQDKRENDMKLREAIAQIEKANHSYQMVWNMKSTLEEKHNKSHEQKKILVKEVKQLRKRIEESEELNDQLSVVNDKMIAVTTDLRQEVEAQRKIIDTQKAAMLASTDVMLHETIQGVSTNDGVDLLETDAAKDSGTGRDRVTSAADKLLDEAKSLSTKSTQSHHESGTTSQPPPKPSTNTESVGTTDNDVEQILNDRSQSGDITPGGDSNNTDIVTGLGRTPSMDWDFSGESSSSSMLNMEWLSPEQRQLAAQRQQSVQGSIKTSESNVKHEKRSSIAMFKNKAVHVFEMMDNKVFHHGNNSRDTVETSEQHDSVIEDTSPQTQPSASENQSKEENGISSKPSENGTPNSFVDASYENGGKPTCFRCGGTVEGPKYSTCKCKVPAMTPLTSEEQEKEHDAMQALKGFFKKGTSKAGGLASVAKRKSMAVGDLFHSSKDSPDDKGNSGHSSSSSFNLFPIIGGDSSHNDKVEEPSHGLLNLDDDTEQQQEDVSEKEEESERSSTTISKNLLDL